MKFWQGFVLLWILFFLFLFVGSFSESRFTMTGYIPFTGVFKEDPSIQLCSPDPNLAQRARMATTH